MCSYYAFCLLELLDASHLPLINLCAIFLFKTQKLQETPPHPQAPYPTKYKIKNHNIVAKDQ